MDETNDKQFPRHPASVPRARAFALKILARWQLTDRLDDVCLCVSELATNAVGHGAPAGRDFLVRIEVRQDLLRIVVHDSGDGIPKVRQAAAEADSGRGLFLVAAVADEWGISPRQGPGKAVWAVFKLSTTTAPRAVVAC